MPAAGPGKTAPKLLSDFLNFDPLVTTKTNLLKDHAPPQGDGPQPAPTIGSCKHEYTTKFKQSILPPLDLRPADRAFYKLAVVCKKCRIHADLHISYSSSINPCPASDHPVHHFQLDAEHETHSSDRIRYCWRCSIAACHAILFILYRPPRLSEADLALLSDPQLLAARYDALLREEPHREGIKLTSQMEALQRLRRYIKDSLDPKRTKRQFPSHNKRFQEAFGINGQECADLLHRFGFTYKVDTWTLPSPQPIEDRSESDGTSLLEVLEDVEIELFAYQLKLHSEQAITLTTEEVWTSANRDIERVLAAQGYTRYVPSRRIPDTNAQLPFYNSLGALPDFSDSLVEYAYDRQTLCDPERQYYYFECLQEITDSRHTEQLQMKVATLESQDVVSRRDISAAYRYLNIPLHEGAQHQDARLLDLFQARQSDLGQSAQEEARTHLYKLGVARGSQLLINASRQSVETYQDALSWLGNGVNKDTPDEALLAVVAIKTAESSANEEIAQKAVSVIARERKSGMLNNWLISGRSDGYTMTIEEALRHLGIETPVDSLDKDVLQVVFATARQDRPGENTNKAIAVVWAAATSEVSASRAPDTWPVGLTSHGNTCYLNSLLQYYFSIKPLRDIILDYDDYKLDTSIHAEKEARVGQRKVNLVEIKGGQRFAEDMKQLFQQMIKSPETAVKPEEDLVCRAFLDPMQYRLLDPALKDASTDSTDQAVNDAAIESKEAVLTNGPLITEPAVVSSEETQDSEASSTTLQASVNGEDADAVMQDSGMPPTPPASPGLKGGGAVPSHIEYAPPALPPRRRFSTAKEEALEIAKTKARQQQDVTEVHDGSMFRLRCGMMPKGQDASDEQVDALRDLFSILIEDTIISKGVEQKPKVLADSNIQLNVPYEATDIYAALDAVFDLQPYGENNSSMETFKTIKALPPLLQINIPRIGYSAQGAYKSNEMIRLEDELYLDRYYDDGQPDLLTRRRKCWAWRKRLQSLKQEQTALTKTPLDLDGPAVVAATAQYLASLDEVNRDLESIGVGKIEADGEITEALAMDAEKQASAVLSYAAEMQGLIQSLDAEFADDQAIKYRLAAVFFHRGQHGHGHYWIYIHDFANNIWRIYNDERVEEFKKLNEIFEAKTFNDGTPTYAVYVDAKKLDMIQAVCRSPERPPTPEQLPASQFAPDVKMTDTTSQEHHHSAGIDPKVVTEGGKSSWDTERTVAAANCSKFPPASVGTAVGHSPVRRLRRKDSMSDMSPSKRSGPMLCGSPPKVARSEGANGKAMEHVENITAIAPSLDDCSSVGDSLSPLSASDLLEAWDEQDWDFE